MEDTGVVVIEEDTGTEEDIEVVEEDIEVVEEDTEPAGV